MREVIVLQQQHISQALEQKLEFASSEQSLGSFQNEFNQTCLSQFQIANELGENSHVPVIAENLDPHNMPHGARSQIKSNFPKGVPSQFENLTFMQKKLLVQLGGARIQHLLKKVKLYSDHPLNVEVSHKPDSPEKMYKLNTGQLAKFFKGREYKLLEQAKKVVQETESDRIYVIYGFLHKFENVIDCFPDFTLKLIDFSSKFQTPQMNEFLNLMAQNPVNCLGFKDFSPTKYITAPDSGYQASSSNINMASVLTGFAAIGIALYGVTKLGMFDSCFGKNKTKEKNEVKTVENEVNKKKL